ncbi:nucleoprotein [La Joya virus]|uniref:Nucleoprotein n=1 Tax=La Joya virus TaxID=1272946 RepID=A0A0D3R0Z9_9RHAB|nr:nucleoprotein [La Joya virus]AJR28298.1 nucleoprotein [La Joya virus]
MKSIRNQTPIKYIQPGDKPKPQYPSEYFASNPQAPLVKIPHPDLDLKGARQIVKASISQGTLDVNVVIRFIYLVGLEFKATLDTKWKSFGVDIGDVGATMCPWNLLTVEFDTHVAPRGNIDQTATKDDDLWMMAYVLFVYRYSRAQMATYKATLFDKFKVQIAPHTDPGFIPTAPHANYSAWLSNRNYCKLIAALDMFFTHFPQHPEAFLRIGTITSRFRDCAALTSLEHYRETVGFKGDDMFGWIFVGTLEEECYILMKPGEELDDPNSYAPYLIDLGLSLKSPYSASTCPSMYTFCHMVGSLLTSGRSQNAKMISDKNLINIRMNALLVAYVFNENVECKIYFTDKEELLRAGLDGQENATQTATDALELQSLGSDNEPPKNKDPVEWFMYLSSLNFQIPQFIRNFGRQEAAKMGQCRVGSIGKYLGDSLV